jgi:nitrite reductase/ring-hydroxylating ferredoxin subunit/uncharacterized membrane protein
MRSAAHFRGHPIHPALIPFPFAFLTGAFVFHLVGRLTGHASLWRTGGYLAVAGITTALLAAIPGLVDYVRTVPPDSSGKRRATLHMVLNLSVVAVFAVATWLGRASPPPGTSILILEGLATAALFIAGWHGGVLVARNQIGVDHRYAAAGRWREANLSAGGGKPVMVARSDELKPNQMKLLRIDGRRLVLARTEDRYVCFDDRCTHKGGSLAGGAMMCGVVQCPWHGSQFDVTKGAVRAGPAKDPVATYPVEERDGQIRLLI